MLMEILAIGQDCLISYLNLYFDEIAEIIRFLLLSRFIYRAYSKYWKIPSFLIF